MTLSVTTMRAAILAELRSPLVVDRVVLPESLECGQVLVKVLYSGICGSQLGEIDGRKGADFYLPHLLGHEGVGEVLEIGPGVRFVRSGERVVLHWKKGVGIDAPPPVYRWQGEKLNAGFVTTFNEYAIVSENRLTAISDDFDLCLAPLFGCAVTTGLGVVVNNARVKPGESTVIFGAGGVGLNIIQGAAMTSAWPIVAVDLFENRLRLARQFGATHTINVRKGRDCRPEILEIVGGNGADVVIDNTGSSEVISRAYELAQPQGRVIMVGVPAYGDNISIYSLPLHFGKILTGSFGGETNPTLDIPRYIKLYQCGKLQLAGLVTDMFSLDDINLAIEHMRSGVIAGRCLLKFHYD